MDWVSVVWLGVLFMLGVLVGVVWAILADSRRQWERVIARRRRED